MENILRFIADVFDINVLALFIISSLFLLFMDAKEYKEQGNKKEYKFSRFFGYFYIVVGLALYVAAGFIRV
jgi:hypothetical protein